MIYDDFLLPGQKEFEKLAKEYSKELLNEVSEKTLDDICYTLKYLQWLYEYVYKNLRLKRLKDEFFKLASTCENSFLFLKDNFKCAEKDFNITKTGRLNNLNSCIKIAIFSEAELVEKMQELSQDFCSLSCIHLNNIKKLCSL
ncbi:MAG: hypothetical protein J5779_01490 [Clostridia bacterium]|nr:hypothetical protein [Clostridia bacterium]